MKKKIILFLAVFTLLASCGYQPIYNNSDLKNIKFEFIEQKGDQQINRLIVNNLKRNQTKKNVKTYIIKIDSQFNKIILAKDKFGSPTDYKLLVRSNFIIDNNKQKLSLEISEEFIYKNLEENYDQSNYENSIKKNLAEQISEKLRTKLLTF
jgi:outer membrane lipopolysaccharide assembly protein LptE/RlpB